MLIPNLSAKVLLVAILMSAASDNSKTFHLDFENQTFDLSYKSMEEASDSIPV